MKYYTAIKTMTDTCIMYMYKHIHIHTQVRIQNNTQEFSLRVRLPNAVSQHLYLLDM